jgi:hypothetical protein
MSVPIKYRPVIMSDKQGILPVMESHSEGLHVKLSEYKRLERLYRESERMLKNLQLRVKESPIVPMDHYFTTEGKFVPCAGCRENGGKLCKAGGSAIRCAADSKPCTDAETRKVRTEVLQQLADCFARNAERLEDQASTNAGCHSYDQAVMHEHQAKGLRLALETINIMGGIVPRPKEDKE